MRSFKLNVLLLLVFSAVLFSCKEDDDDNNNNNQPTQSVTNPAPDFPDADGILAAIVVKTYQEVPVIGVQGIETEQAFAQINEVGSNTVLADAGTVTCNTVELGNIGGNQYIFPNPNNPTAMDDMQLDDNDPVAWDISGSADVDALSYTTNAGVPDEFDFVTVQETASAGSAFTIEIDQVPTQADSILWLLVEESSGDLVRHTTANNVVSYTFTAAETADLSGNVLAYAVAYNYDLVTSGGRNLYFINEYVLLKTTEFQ